MLLPKSSPLWAWQPAMRYYILEERHHPVEKGGSLTGLLFEMENCRNSVQLTSVIERLAKLVKKPSDAPLKRAFLKVIKAVLAQRRGINIQNENFSELSEVKEMLSTRLKQWEEEFKEKGLAEGIKEGIEQGIEQSRQEGESLLLRSQLESRYGPLPKWVEEKLSTADSQTLERWGIKLLDAQSIDEVFK